jgi:hypothetical protein
VVCTAAGTLHTQAPKSTVVCEEVRDLNSKTPHNSTSRRTVVSCFESPPFGNCNCPNQSTICVVCMPARELLQRSNRRVLFTTLQLFASSQTNLMRRHVSQFVKKRATDRVVQLLQSILPNAGASIHIQSALAGSTNVHKVSSSVTCMLYMNSMES